MESAAHFFSALAPSSWFFWHDEPPIEGEYSEEITPLGSSVAAIPKENYFEFLPNEVLRLIFSHLSLQRIATLELVYCTWHQVGRTIEPRIRAIDNSMSNKQGRYTNHRIVELFQNKMFFGTKKKNVCFCDLKTGWFWSSPNTPHFFLPIIKKNEAFCLERGLIATTVQKESDAIFLELKKISLWDEIQQEPRLVCSMPVRNNFNDFKLAPRKIIFAEDRIVLVSECYTEKVHEGKIKAKFINKYVVNVFFVNGSSLAEEQFYDKKIRFVVGDNEKIVFVDNEKNITVVHFGLNGVRTFFSESLPGEVDNYLPIHWNCRIQLIENKLFIPRTENSESCQIIDLSEEKISDWTDELLKRCTIEAFDSDGDYLAIATHSIGAWFSVIRRIEIWNFVRGEFVRQIEIDRNNDNRVSNLRFSKGAPANLPDNFPGYPARIAITRIAQNGIQVWSSPYL